MAEKILNTRLLLKYDSYANWTTNNPILKAGEMAVATVANNEANQATGFTNLPNIVLKVGDGTSHYNDLKFVSALAADVHTWAKAASKPTYEYTEITGLEDELARVSAAADTDTHYNLVATDAANHKYELRSKEKNAVEWTKVADLDLSGIVSRVKALEDKFVGMEEATVVAHVQKRIEALDVAEVKVGQGEIIEAISEADGMISVSKRALVKEDIPTIEQTQVNGLPKALEDINTAIGNAQSGSLEDAKKYVDEKFDALDYAGGEFGEHKFAIKVTEADGAIEVEYAQPTISDIAELPAKIQEIEGDIDDLEANKQDNLGFEGEYNKETNKVVTKAHLTSVIEDLESDGAGFGDHKFVIKVTEADGIVTPEYAQPVIADIDGLTDRLSGIDGEIAKKQDQLYFTSTPDNANNKVATQTYVNEAVANLEGAMHFIGKVDALPADGTGYNAGDVIMVPDAEDSNVMVEYVLDKTGTWQKLGHESIYELKADAKTKHEAIEKAIADLEKKHDDEMDALEEDHTERLNALDAAYKKAIADLDHDEVKAGTGEIIEAVSQADGAISVSKRALVAADIPELAQSKITGLVDKLNEIDQAITDAEGGALADAKKYADEQILAKINDLDAAEVKAGQGEIIDSVSEADGIVTVTKRALVKEDIPVIEQTQVNGLGDSLAAAAKAGTDAAAQALADAKADAQARIEALDSSITEETDKVVAGFSIVDGVITPESVKKVTLAKVATTGNVRDLIQTAGDYLVFNCGNSQVGTENEFVM